MELSSTDLWSLVQPRLRTYMTQTWDATTVAEVTESTPQTVAYWLTELPPGTRLGTRLIKLWHLLAALGLDSPELDQLPTFNRLCGEIHTFAGVDLTELAKIIGIRNEQGALLMLRGVVPARPAYNIEELTELYGKQIEEARAKLKPLLTVSIVDTAQPSQVATPESAEKTDIELTLGGDRVLTAAMLFNAALPLARQLDDDGSNEDRANLRALMGEESMFALSNHFYNLCGPRARDNRRK